MHDTLDRGISITDQRKEKLITAHQIIKRCEEEEIYVVAEMHNVLKSLRQQVQQFSHLDDNRQEFRPGVQSFIRTHLFNAMYKCLLNEGLFKDHIDDDFDYNTAFCNNEVRRQVQQLPFDIDYGDYDVEEIFDDNAEIYDDLHWG